MSSTAILDLLSTTSTNLMFSAQVSCLFSVPWWRKWPDLIPKHFKWMGRSWLEIIWRSLKRCTRLTLLSFLDCFFVSRSQIGRASVKSRLSFIRKNLVVRKKASRWMNSLSFITITITIFLKVQRRTAQLLHWSLHFLFKLRLQKKSHWKKK